MNNKFALNSDLFTPKAISLFIPKAIGLSLVILSCFFVGFLSTSSSTALAAERIDVRALYQIHAPVGSGKFQFASRQQGNRYQMVGSAKFKAFLGIFNWKSSLSSHGAVAAHKPKPALYSFHSKTKKKRETVKLVFADNKITKVRALPPTKPHPNRVKLQKNHLKNVVDPLSAVMTFTDKNPSLRDGRKACNRQVEIFDGRQRFNLVLSYKRRARAELAGSRAKLAFVCRARYQPIAGFKWNKATKYIANSKGLEVWLVPLPKAKMYVPYRIVVPIMIGTATVELTKFQVHSNKIGRIALAR